MAESIESVMTRDPVCMDAGASLADAAKAMDAVRRMPVLDEGRPVGIVSLGDLAEERDGPSVLGEISAAPANH